MSGKKHKRKPKGDRRSDPVDAPKIPPELAAEIEEADAEHRRLLAIEGDYAHMRRVHLAASKLWTLRSTACYLVGDHDAARKASTTGNEHAALAAKLERDSLADRVAALEAEVARRRSLGRELEELDE